MSELEASEQAVVLICQEYVKATEKNGPFNSAHEGYAILKEEMDELWEEVKKKASDRDSEKLLKEVIQVAAMGMRFAVDICKEELIKGGK